nr:MAG TPA: hypothetical protein [Caudoviricetes sp.]DAO54988.1 MAG TPA: hypothetical protein [Caudoviricetes sp.]
MVSGNSKSFCLISKNSFSSASLTSSCGISSPII